MLNRINFRLLQRISSFRPTSSAPSYQFKRWYSSSDGSSESTSTPKLYINELKANAKFTAYDGGAVDRVYNALLKLGFTDINCAKVIDKYPDILRIKPQMIEERFEMWQMCQFSHSQLYELFVQSPEFFEINDDRRIAKRYGYFRSLVSTPKNIWRLFMSCPNILVDDIRSIQKKVDYVLETMEADITDLVKSGTLGLPLITIKTRHMLLMRMGIYKKRNWKASELETNKNPRLSRIMDSNDEEFATKLCGISTKELDAFTELYERELEEDAKAQDDWDQLDEQDSDLESDTDDDEFDARESNDYYDDRDRRRYKK